MYLARAVEGLAAEVGNGGQRRWVGVDMKLRQQAALEAAYVLEYLGCLPEAPRRREVTRHSRRC